MKDVVSFKTGRILKELGFQKEDNILLIPRPVSSLLSYGVCSVSDFITSEDIPIPSATDIMRQFNTYWRLQYVSGLFQCYQIDKMFSDENPAEACAAAWIYEQQNKLT
jgi:hypothetical protein